MKKKLLPWIIALSALSVSGSAAFYSVSGLGKMFAGASTEVMLLAGSLEFAKLVTASLLYQYWKKLNIGLKLYLSIATLVLIIITSAGIYGFLSSAYQETANKSGIEDQKILSLEQKKTLYEKNRDGYQKEYDGLFLSKEKLSEGLSKGSIIQSVDKNGNVITRSNRAGIKTFEKQIESIDTKLNIISEKISIANDSIFSIDSKILETKTSSTVSDELGPLRYISNLTGKSLDTVVNWYIIVLMLVFDPLAISLVVAANFAFEMGKDEEKEKDNKITKKDKNMKILKFFKNLNFKSKNDTEEPIIEKIEENKNEIKENPIIEWDIEKKEDTKIPDPEIKDVEAYQNEEIIKKEIIDNQEEDIIVEKEDLQENIEDIIPTDNTYQQEEDMIFMENQKISRERFRSNPGILRGKDGRNEFRNNPGGEGGETNPLNLR